MICMSGQPGHLKHRLWIIRYTIKFFKNSTALSSGEHCSKLQTVLSEDSTISKNELQSSFYEFEVAPCFGLLKAREQRLISFLFYSLFLHNVGSTYWEHNEVKWVMNINQSIDFKNGLYLKKYITRGVAVLHYFATTKTLKCWKFGKTQDTDFKSVDFVKKPREISREQMQIPESWWQSELNKTYFKIQKKPFNFLFFLSIKTLKNCHSAIKI